MDQAWGFVLDVYDGDTFTLDISSVREGNAYDYGDIERVRLRSASASELNDPGGREARDRLRRQIAGRRVRIDIYSQDVYGRVLADVDPNPTKRRR